MNRDAKLETIMIAKKDDRDILKGHVHLQDGHGYIASSWCFDEELPDGRTERHELEKGDILMVFNDAARSESLWSGVVDFDYDSNKQIVHAMGFRQQKLEGVGSIEGLPRGGETVEKTWIRMFKANKPALLIKAPKA